MKNFYIAFSFVIASSSLCAQNAATKKADKLFNRYEYVAAAEEYLKLVDNGKSDAYIYKQLADTYYNMFNATESVKWYAKATENSQDAETYYRYAQMLKANGKYEEANKQMQKFASLAPNDQRAKTFKENQIYNASISNVQIQNDQLILTGNNLNIITQIKTENADKSFVHQFVLESKSQNQIIARWPRNIINCFFCSNFF